MQVTLKSYTPNALELLVGTKTTRMRGKSPSEMTQDELYDHFQYMLDTIKSPFEFVDYIVHIEGVSKNFTHQLVRTRTGAYQQETSRALEVKAFDTVRPAAFEWPAIEGGAEDNPQRLLASMWDDAMADADANYKSLIEAGAELQDARAALPSNMPTVIDAKFNLRTLSDMAKVRLCARTQGEYQHVFREIRRLILEIHPWAAPLLDPHCVATGTCAFPRWGSKVVFDPIDPAGGMQKAAHYQCPHYDKRMDLTEAKREYRVKFWSRDEIAQANPVAKDGKSM